tara:strand:- start:507 stop:1313 length:807 start_codon:yes stop_codon:yes gene_type:complete
MDEYYKFKQKYDKKKASAITKIYNKTNKTIEKKRIDAKKYVPPCINCKRKVGSIFLNNNNLYTIKCGDVEEPCDLDFSASKVATINLEDIINNREKYIDRIRESIIRTKLDFLYKYDNEENTLSKFNKQKAELNTENQHIHERKAEFSKRLNINERTHNTAIDNSIYNETLKQIRENSTEFKKSGENSYLNENALLTKDIMMPLLKRMRQTKYDVSKIESYEMNNETFYKMYNVKNDIKNLEEKIISSMPKSTKDAVEETQSDTSVTE